MPLAQPRPQLCRDKLQSCLHRSKMATKGLVVLGMEWVRAHDLQQRPGKGLVRHKLCDLGQAPSPKGDSCGCEITIIRAYPQVVVRIKGDPAEGRFCETSLHCLCGRGVGCCQSVPVLGTAREGGGTPRSSPHGQGQGARQDERDQHSAIPMEPRALWP